MPEKRLVVCVNERMGIGQKSCAGSGSRELAAKISEIIQQRGLGIEIVEQVCLGRCDEGITMRIAPGGRFFTRVTPQDFDDILAELERFQPAPGR